MPYYAVKHRHSEIFTSYKDMRAKCFGKKYRCKRFENIQDAVRWAFFRPDACIVWMDSFVYFDFEANSFNVR